MPTLDEIPGGPGIAQRVVAALLGGTSPIETAAMTGVDLSVVRRIRARLVKERAEEVFFGWPGSAQVGRTLPMYLTLGIAIGALARDDHDQLRLTAAARARRWEVLK